MPEKQRSKYSYQRKNVWDNTDSEYQKKINDFAENYKLFINRCKTEREVVQYTLEQIKGLGFQSIEESALQPGSRVFMINNQKSIALAIIGKKDIREGVNIVAGHIDCPRLDLKPLPLIEEHEIALMKTHYYGGIKKYQWLNIPLSLHGTVILNDGSTKHIVIGEDKNDPVFTIPDLLPHLAKKVQGEKKFFEGIVGENLNIIVGSIPLNDSDISERVKENILVKLNEEFGMIEEDFISAEFEIVPAFEARDVGIDRSMIGAYGHDDRLCSYNAYRALIDMEEIPEKTAIVYLVDKEEIGSVGITSVKNSFFLNFMSKLIDLLKKDSNISYLRDMIDHSFAISGDVGTVVNPMFPEVHDLRNAARLGCGIIIEKYTGSRGKYGGSDASAELMGKVRKIFNDNKIFWQSGSLGKVDEGGGGTIAFEIAEMGIQVVDSGAGVMGMHSPFEIVSKADIYETYRGYSAFLKQA